MPEAGRRSAPRLKLAGDLLHGGVQCLKLASDLLHGGVQCLKLAGDLLPESEEAENPWQCPPNKA